MKADKLIFFNLILFLLVLNAALVITPVKSATTGLSYTLTIEKAISIIPSDGNPHPSFLLSIKDSLGKPRLAPSRINVTLASSDERVLWIPQFVQFEIGDFYKIINATSNVITKKSVEVTASASGYLSSKVNAQVEPPSGTPYSLKVTLLPNVVGTTALSPQVIDAVIAIYDTYGNPTISREDCVVTITSSNLRVAEIVGNSTTIPAERTSTIVKISTKGVAGSSIITATAPNLKSSSATLSVTGPKVEKIYLWSLGTQIVGEENIALVAILDGSGKPTRFSSPIIISFSTSNSSRFTCPTEVEIPTGGWRAIVSIRCVSEGSAEIYASASDIDSASITVLGKKAEGPPVGQQLYSPINNILVDENQKFPLIIQLVDKKGSPAKTQSNVLCNIFSDNSEILQPTPQVTIPNGTSNVVINSIVKSPGEVKITSLSQNLTKSEIKTAGYVPLPTSIIIECQDLTVDEESEACIITINNNLPTPVIDETTFTISSSNTGVAAADTIVKVGENLSYAYFKILGVTPGTLTLTVTGSGLLSQSIEFKVTEIKPITFSVIAFTPIVDLNFPIVVQSVSSMNTPMVNFRPIILNVTSSNPKNVSVQALPIIDLNKTETVITGNGLGNSSTTITISSTGYKSVTVKVTPITTNSWLQIISGKSYIIGETINIKAQVILDDRPVPNVSVKWSGDNLEKEVSTTDAEGYASNNLTVRDKYSIIRASIYIKSKILDDEITITGLRPTYYLDVTTNIPYTIDGSGEYKVNSKVTVNTPASVKMDGLFGILGGKYNFNRWGGALNSTKNLETVVMSGDDERISVIAYYNSDYPYLILAGLIGAGVIGGVIVYYFKFRREE